jgi:hypothetical protein
MPFGTSFRGNTGYAPGPFKQIPRAEATSAQFPRLAPFKQLVVKEGSFLAAERTKHQSEAKEVSIDAAPGRSLTCERRMRVHRMV